MKRDELFIIDKLGAVVAGRPRKNEGLTLDRIIDGAWRLVDREGIESLSTRKLAAELDVQGPALYWHVKSKRELMSLMIEQALFGSIAKAPSDLPWWEWLRAVGQEQRKSLLSHRDSGLIASRTSPTKKLRDEIFEGVVEKLVEIGFSRTAGAAAWGGLARMVIGTVIYEQNEDTNAFATTFVESEESFEYCLDAYIIGLRQKVGDL